MISSIDNLTLWSRFLSTLEHKWTEGAPVMEKLGVPDSGRIFDAVSMEKRQHLYIYYCSSNLGGRCLAVKQHLVHILLSWPLQLSQPSVDGEPSWETCNAPPSVDGEVL